MCTLIVIIEQVLLYIPLICGAYIVLSLMKIPDLSLQSSFVIGAVCASSMLAYAVKIQPGMSAGLAIIASIVGGALVGLISSAITQVGRIPHLLSSIITIGICYGAVLYALNGASRTYAHNPLAKLLVIDGYPELGAMLVITGGVLVCVACFLRTQLGYACAAYGDNPLFLHHYGMATRYVFIMGSIIGNALAGLSGYLFAQSSGFVDVTMGTDVVLLCITTLMIGKLVLRIPKPLTLVVPIAGLVLYCALQQVLLKLYLNPQYFSGVQALTILGIALYVFSNHNRRPSAHDHLGV